MHKFKALSSTVPETMLIFKFCRGVIQREQNCHWHIMCNKTKFELNQIRETYYTLHSGLSCITVAFKMHQGHWKWYECVRSKGDYHNAMLSLSQSLRSKPTLRCLLLLFFVFSLSFFKSSLKTSPFRNLFFSPIALIYLCVCVCVGGVRACVCACMWACVWVHACIYLKEFESI